MWKWISYIALLIPFLLNLNTVQAQHEEHEYDAGHYIPRDTGIHNIRDFFKRSHIHGHARNYFMATVNEGGLHDYWTNAVGGALKFETPTFYGIQVGVKGIFSYRTFSSDLSDIDSTVNKGAKWEVELYDVNRPEVKADLDRLEELYVKFNFGKSYVQYGKIDINRGPLLLRRDGRMKPFVFKGFWSEINELKHQSFTLGWIHGVSPRGMTEWFSIHEAIGLLNNGWQPDGSDAEYHDVVHTKGIGVFGFQDRSIKGLKLNYWGYWFHELFYMNWFQADYEYQRWFGGAQFVLQTPTHQNALEYNHRYMQPDEKGIVLNVRGGVQSLDKRIALSLNFLRSFKKGRFLFPRELGRENFYVSQPRAWVDGFGNTNIYMLRVTWKPLKRERNDLVIDTRWSYIDDPGLDNPTFNKYNFVSYYQATIDVLYRFNKWLKGLELHVLYVGRYTPDTENVAESSIYYRTNFHHINFIANINF